jgi:hypothetical protein
MPSASTASVICNSLALSFVIPALRVLRPIQRKAVTYKPFAEVRTTDRAGRDRAAIRVEANWNTIDGTAGNEGVKVVRGLRPATIEPQFVCQGCGNRGAEVRPDFERGNPQLAIMGYRNTL